MKYESNTKMNSKDIAQKPFSYLQDGTYERDIWDVRTRVMLYASPHLKRRGYNEQGFCIHIRDGIVVRKGIFYMFSHISLSFLLSLLASLIFEHYARKC